MQNRGKWVISVIVRNVLLFAGSIFLLCTLLALIPDRYAPGFTERVADYIVMAFTFDFGISIETGFPVVVEVFARVYNTFLLLFLTILFVLAVAVPTGILGALYPQNLFQRALVTIIYGLSTIPVLLWATILTLAIFLGLNQVLMLSDYESADWAGKVMIIAPPVFALSIGDGMLYDIYRTVRDQIANLQSEPWMKSLRSRGRSVKGHLSRGLVEPLVTVLSSKLTYLISGTIVVEYIFNWPGLGMLIWDAIADDSNKDYPVIIASVMILIVLVIGSNIAKETTHYLMNPQYRDEDIVA
jgi:peptide/nickel transport system permease protein